MKKHIFHTWDSLNEWAENIKPNNRYVFRGQGDKDWSLKSSLARHFLEHEVVPNEWRKRELKMYRMFRERLLMFCPGMYDDWNPIDILSLMQHHGTPTRLIDFTHSPLVAAYFALKDARGDSAIWVIDKEMLDPKLVTSGFAGYSGPTHIEDYKIADKHPTAIVLEPSYPHLRLAAQHGCFLVPGRISKKVSSDLIYSRAILSEKMVLESLKRLRGQGIDEDYLYPDLDQIARDTNRFSVSGNADYQ